MTETTNQTKPDFAASELSVVLGFDAFRPVAWMRKHPDGTLTGEMLTDESIEGSRTASGAWEPLYTKAAAARALGHARTVLDHNADLHAEIERLRAALIEIARVEPLGNGMQHVVYGHEAQAYAAAALVPNTRICEPCKVEDGIQNDKTA